MLALEAIHHMKCKKKGNIGEMALKVDFSRAFDIVDWSYLLRLMEKMGFHKKWIGWMILCLKTV